MMLLGINLFGQISPNLLNLLKDNTTDYKLPVRDWRFVPDTVYGTFPQMVYDSINNENRSTEFSITAGTSDSIIFYGSDFAKLYFHFELEYSQNVVPFIVTYRTSTDSVNWSGYDTLDLYRFHQQVDIDAVYEITNEGYSCFKFTNNYTSDINCNWINLYEAETNPYLKDDYWLILGASITYSGLKPDYLLDSIRSKTDYDPLIVLEAYPGRTVGWLLNRLDTILQRNPNANYVITHIGGNDVSGYRPYSEQTTQYKTDRINYFVSMYKSLLNNDLFPFVGRLTFRDYKVDPICYGGGEQQNGSKPFNKHIIDSLTRLYGNWVINPSSNNSLLDYYTFTLNNQSFLSIDGVHLNSEGCSDFREFTINTAFNYIYKGHYPTPLTPETFSSLIEDAELYTTTAENSGLNTDINRSQYQIDLLPVSDADTAAYFQNRLDAVTCIDCNISRVLIDMGSSPLASPNWNGVSGVKLTPNSFYDLIDDKGAATTINLSVLSPAFDGYSGSIGMQSGDDSYMYPDAAFIDGYNARNDSVPLLFEGLDNNTEYTFKFLSSYKGTSTKRGIVITCFNTLESDTLASSDDNTTYLLTFNVTPTNGQALFKVLAYETWGYGYINAIEINY